MNTSYEEEVSNTIQYRLLQNLFNLISSTKSIAQVKAIANKNLDDLTSLLNDDNGIFNMQLLREINEYRKLLNNQTLLMVVTLVVFGLKALVFRIAEKLFKV